jgi:hypothetical protein
LGLTSPVFLELALAYCKHLYAAGRLSFKAVYSAKLLESIIPEKKIGSPSDASIRWTAVLESNGIGAPKGYAVGMSMSEHLGWKILGTTQELSLI